VVPLLEAKRTTRRHAEEAYGEFQSQRSGLVDRARTQRQPLENVLGDGDLGRLLSTRRATTSPLLVAGSRWCGRSGWSSSAPTVRGKTTLLRALPGELPLAPG